MMDLYSVRSRVEDQVRRWGRGEAPQHVFAPCGRTPSTDEAGPSTRLAFVRPEAVSSKTGRSPRRAASSVCGRAMCGRAGGTGWRAWLVTLPENTAIQAAQTAPKRAWRSARAVRDMETPWGNARGRSTARDRACAARIGALCHESDANWVVFGGQNAVGEPLGMPGARWRACMAYRSCVGREALKVALGAFGLLQGACFASRSPWLARRPQDRPRPAS